MAWAVTLKVTDCDTGANLQGAFITDGTVTYFTDANGEFVAVINDAYHTYVVNIGKSGYLTKTFAINRDEHEGTIQTICLNPAEGSDDNGNDDGW